jgi:pilus assembly protein CpaB
MILRLALFMLMAVGLGGFGTVAWLTTRSPAAHHAPAPKPVPLLAAAHALQPGALLKPTDLGVTMVAATQVPPGATADTPQARAALIGAMVRRSMVAGETVLPADVMRPGDHGFLAAVLAPGRLAVSVGVDAITGTAGLIWPGDHVDLILTQSMSGAHVPPARQVAGETVLTDVRVIAIDQQLVQGAGSNGAKAEPARTVTLEVTPVQAEQVAVATRLGHLSLAVRSAAAGQAAAAAAATPAGITWAGQVSPALTEDGQIAGGTVRVFTGASDGKEFRF